MGFVIGDLARTEEDFQKCIEIVQRLEPFATLAPIGKPGNITYIARDEDHRDKIVALIHVEQALEVRHLLVEPDFGYKEASFTLLHRCMEMNMRVGGATKYYFTVEKNNKRAVQIFKRDGAVQVDTEALRFVKEL